MKYLELQQKLQEITGLKISQSKIGEIIGTSRQNIGSKFNNPKSEVSVSELQKLENFYKVSLYEATVTNKMDEPSVLIDYYPDVIASCGPGGFEMSQECIQYDVPATLFPPSQNVKGYSMCHAKGNSMYPRIWDGDFVICEHKDNMKIENGEMYIFCFDDQIYLKRLTKNINQIVVESENPDFSTQYIEKEDMNNVHLIGHVVCFGRMNGKYLDKRI